MRLALTVARRGTDAELESGHFVGNILKSGAAKWKSDVAKVEIDATLWLFVTQYFRFETQYFRKIDAVFSGLRRSIFGFETQYFRI